MDITILEQTVVAAIVYFGQVFVFCSLIYKKVLEWFLLIMCKEDILCTSTILLRNHPILSFWLREEGRKMPNTY